MKRLIELQTCDGIAGLGEKPDDVIVPKKKKKLREILRRKRVQQECQHQNYIR